MGAFHAYDIRGIYNKDFDRNTAYKVGFFLPELLGTKRVLVGRDVRTSSPEIREWLVAGITDAGADVVDILPLQNMGSMHRCRLQHHTIQRSTTE